MSVWPECEERKGWSEEGHETGELNESRKSCLEALGVTSEPHWACTVTGIIYVASAATVNILANTDVWLGILILMNTDVQRE